MTFDLPVDICCMLVHLNTVSVKFRGQGLSSLSDDKTQLWMQFVNGNVKMKLRKLQHVHKKGSLEV